MQAFSSSASCSSSLTLSFLCGRAHVMLLCIGPYLLSRPSGEQRPGCPLPSSLERDFPSLMYQVSDRLTSFSLSSVHPLIPLLIPQKVGWQIYGPKLYASCRQKLSNPQHMQEVLHFVFLDKALSIIFAFLGNTSYKTASVGSQEQVL